MDLRTLDQNTPEKKLSFSELARKKTSSLLSADAGEKFTTSLVALVQQNKGLQACEPNSLILAALQAHSLGLPLNRSLGQAWIIPFKQNRKSTMSEASFVVGYKGYLQLAIRSGYYRKINVLTIKEGELRNFDPLNEVLDVELIQDEYEREQAETVGYYAMYEYLNGFRKSVYWSKEKMLSHADRYSQAFSLNGNRDRVSYADFVAGKYPKSEEYKYSSFWYKDFDSMAKKTMIRHLLTHWGILSVDMQTALASDMRVLRDDNKSGPVIDIIEKEQVIPADYEIVGEDNAEQTGEQNTEEQAPIQESRTETVQQAAFF